MNPYINPDAWRTHGVAPRVGERPALCDQTHGIRLRGESASNARCNRSSADDKSVRRRGNVQPILVKGSSIEKRVVYYVPGLEQWKFADRLEDISKRSLTLYLHSDGRANDAFHSGSMTEGCLAQETADKYVYDPLDVRSAEVER